MEEIFLVSDWTEQNELGTSDNLGLFCGSYFAILSHLRTPPDTASANCVTAIKYLSTLPDGLYMLQRTYLLDAALDFGDNAASEPP